MTDEQETSPAPEDAQQPASPQPSSGTAPPPAPVEEEKKKINRQEFLNLAWLASLGIIAVNAGVVTVFFALPRFKAGEFGGEFTIQPENIPSTDEGPANDPKGRFWLSHTEPGINALYVVCTHLGCLYGWLPDQGFFRCPCHGSQFFKEGTYKAGPAPRSLDQFVVKIMNKSTNELIAELNRETHAPVPLPDNADYYVVVDTGEKVNGNPK
jgi:cytochrome b6-f complex iron-sulfur subunit